MEKQEKRIAIVISLIVLSAILLMGSGVSAFAADNKIPKEGVLYTLTYPDGMVIEENEDGDPLTYSDVTKALKKENWILLGSGYRSNAKGKVVLPAAWKEGTIRIVETKVPDGYTRGKESEKVAELADTRLNKLAPHSDDAGAAASGDTVTLTTVMSQGWDDSTEKAEQ